MLRKKRVARRRVFEISSKRELSQTFFSTRGVPKQPSYHDVTGRDIDVIHDHADETKKE